MFLTWHEAETPVGTTFNVYVADRPIADLTKARTLVELGSGSSEKTHLLLRRVAFSALIPSPSGTPVKMKFQITADPLLPPLNSEMMASSEM